MAPIVHGLEAKYSGQIDFVYLNIDDPKNADAKQQLGFRGQPQFILLDADGTARQVWFGVVKAEDFETELAQALTP